jgi:hypothetical protein
MLKLGRAMIHEFSCPSLTSEARLHARSSQRGIYGGQISTGTGFSPSSLVFSCQYHVLVYSHITYIIGRLTTGPLKAAVHRHSVTPSTSAI